MYHWCNNWLAESEKTCMHVNLLIYSAPRVEDELDNSIQSRYKNASKAVTWRYYCRTPQVDIPSWNSHQLHLAKFQTAHHGRLRECKGAPAREHGHGQEELVSHDKSCPCPHDKAKATRKRSKDLDSTQAGNRDGITPESRCGEACLNHAKQCEAGFCEASWPGLARWNITKHHKLLEDMIFRYITHQWLRKIGLVPVVVTDRFQFLTSDEGRRRVDFAARCPEMGDLWWVQPAISLWGSFDVHPNLCCSLIIGGYKVVPQFVS